MSKTFDTKLKFSGQKRHFDITIPSEYNNFQSVVVKLLEVCAPSKSYIQEEVGLSGYRHIQGRVSFKKQFREGEILKFIHALQIKGIHVSLTSSLNMDNFEYVSKQFTQQGESGFLADLKKAPNTTQLLLFEKFTLRPFQVQILELTKVFDIDCINVILDKIGLGGKSIFVEWLCYTGNGFQVPPYLDMEKMMGFCMSFKEHKNYYIDMPRGLKGSQLNQFMSGIESLKNGYLYDGRHKGTFRRQSRPNIFLFTNDVPPIYLLSKARWRIWQMKKDFSLKKMTAASFIKAKLHIGDVTHDLDYGL